MKFIKGTLIAAIVILGVAAFMLAYLDSPVNDSDVARAFTIRRGDSAAEVARRLRDEGFVRSSFYFLLVSELGDRTRGLKTGQYRISGSMSTRRIVERLATERPEERKFRITVPEGLTALETAARFQENGLCSAREFLSITRNPAANGIDTRGHSLPDLEGFLYPETYFLDERSTCAATIQRMVSQFFNEMPARDIRRAAEIGLTLRQAVTLASLVEEEAKADSERRTISGVLHNRLKANMLLQVDASVQYALPGHKERLYYKDLEVDSPYNTYKHPGLPPGPICNPGVKSIRAALYPEETDYYYYVARGDGSHIFSRSNNEHNNARNRVKQKNRR